MIEIYTDGSSKGNPGSGGWAAVVYKNNVLITYRADYEENVTNNRMELKGLLCGLLFANEIAGGEKIIIYSDSAYCVNALNNWIVTWKKNNWKRGKNEEVKNRDLFEKLYPLYWNEDGSKKANIEIQKVTGHYGVVGNELADALCSNNKKKAQIILSKENYNAAIIKR